MVSSIADKRDVDYDDQDENEHSGLFDPANLKASDLDTDESESEREDPDKRLGSSFARSSNSSLASMSSPEDRLEAIQKSNAELGRKLKESGNLLQQRMAEHDAEVDELQNRLEETRSQLQAAKREEKELRSKEVNVFRYPHLSSI
jgi:chromosome segregation ATPase